MAQFSFGFGVLLLLQMFQFHFGWQLYPLYYASICNWLLSSQHRQNISGCGLSGVWDLCSWPWYLLSCFFNRTDKLRYYTSSYTLLNTDETFLGVVWVVCEINAAHPGILLACCIVANVSIAPTVLDIMQVAVSFSTQTKHFWVWFEWCVRLMQPTFGFYQHWQVFNSSAVRQSTLVYFNNNC